MTAKAASNAQIKTFQKLTLIQILPYTNKGKCTSATLMIYWFQNVINLL